MNDKIRRFSVGNFAGSMAKICLSENSIAVRTDEGKKAEGSFYIGNDQGISMTGILYSDCRHISFKNPYLKGSEVAVSYTFDPDGLSAGETFESGIYAITSCGEVRIPFTAEITVPSIKLEEGELSDLTEFAKLAKNDSGRAMDIFRSDAFAPVFLYKDIRLRHIYETVIKSPQTAQAMEEFLIDANKKNRITINTDRNNITYENCDRDIYDTVTVSKNTWGYAEIKISTDCGFIVPEHKRMWTDRFQDDADPLHFRIDASKLSPGQSEGRIFLDTALQHVEIKVRCVKNGEGARSRATGIKAGLYRGYLDYLTGQTDEGGLASRIDKILVDNRAELSGEAAEILEIYKRFLRDKSTECCMDAAHCLDGMDAPGTDAPLSDVLIYCAACYLASLAYSYMGDDGGARACAGKIMEFYESGYDEPLIFYFLIKSHGRYQNRRTAFGGMVKYLKDGQASPLIYFELCRVANEEPQLIHEWADELTAPLAWGAKRRLLNKDAAMVFTYHAGRIKAYKPYVIRSLCSLYGQYGLPDTLQVICGMFIRADIISEESHKWYGLGIEKQLRITKIYEYFMMSLDENDETPLPRQVVMYFMYDNNLAAREKAMLFSSVIKGKQANPAAYKAYSLMIRGFAKEQLEAGRINRNLAVIYTDFFRYAKIDETIAESLPEVMFKHELTCGNPNMKEVCVVTEALDGEEITPLEGGRALIDMPSPDTTIYLIDGKGNRYLGSGFYTIHKLLRLEGLADKCFELCPGNVKLLTYMFSMCEKNFHADDDAIRVRRYAGRLLPLNGYFQRRNLSVLITYYYEHAEGEFLDEILEDLDLDVADYETRGRWIELFIVRGMREAALLAIKKYGHGGVGARLLGRLFDEEAEEAGIDKESDALSDIAYSIFAEGSYSDNILRYLARYYAGPAGKMMKLWDTLKAFGLDTVEIEGKILALLAFTENTDEGGQQVLLSYLGHGDDKTVVKAYACFISHRYLMDGLSIRDEVWQWLWDNMASENNTCRILAMLKRLSELPKLPGGVKSFCDVKVNEMINKGIVMSFYKRFLGKINLSGGIGDKVIIQCCAAPGLDIMARYSFSGGEKAESAAEEVFYGIYVKELPVFIDEEAEYEFYEKGSQPGAVLKSGHIAAHEIRGGDEDITRFNMINTMIKYGRDKDIDKLYGQMERYIRLDWASKKLFKLL